VSRIILIVLAIPVVLVILAALLIPLLLDEQKILDIAAQALKEESGAVLVVDGEVNLSIFPSVSLALGDISIALPGEQEMRVEVRALGIGLELMPLFSGQMEVGEITVDGLVMTVKSAPPPPTLDTSVLSDEQLDEYYEKRRAELDSAGQAAGRETIAALPLALNVQRLSVTDSVLALISTETQETTRINIINFEATGLNLADRAIPLQMEIQLEGSTGSAPIALALEGVVKVNADTRVLTLEALTVEVNGVLATTVTAQISGVIDLTSQVADLQLGFDLGDIRGDGALRYASFESPQIDANLHLNKFDPALMALAGPDAAAANDAGNSDTGLDGDKPLPLNALRAIDTKAVLSIDSANFGGHVIEKMRVRLRVVDGIARIIALTGTLHGGKLNMKATLNGQHNTAKLHTTGGLTGMDIGAALEAMNAEPIVSGKVDLQWQLRSRGGTSNQLVETMNGPIDLLTSEVTLKNLGIDKMLCEVVALANRETLSATLPDNTRFDTLSVNMKMNRGKLRMQPLVADLPHVKLRGKGVLDLLAQDFSATFTARLSPGLGELDPACRVNDRLTAIGWPVNCKGNITGDPADWCGVDSQKILEQMATKEVQRQVEKEAGKLLDKLFKK